jgi:hypothetical protein
MIILPLLALLSLTQIGLLTTFLITKKIHLSISLAVGMGTITLLQLLLGLLNIKINQQFVLLISIASFVPLLIKSPLYLRQRLVHHLNTALRRLSLPTVVILVAATAILTLPTLSQIIWGHDAYAFWLSKGRAFWIDGQITQENIQVYWPQDHPLLWPLTISWFYHFTGQGDGLWIRLIPFAIYLNLALVFASLPGKKTSHSLWLTIFLLTPFLYQNVVTPEFSGNADLILSGFLFLAIYQTLFKNNFTPCGLLLGLSIFVKNDSLPALLTFLAIMLYRKSSLKVFLAPTALLVFSLFLKSHYHLQNRFLNQDFSLLFAHRSLPSTLYYSLHSIREELRQIYRWGLGWWLILFSTLTHIKKILHHPNLTLCLFLIIAQILGYLAAYLITPEDAVGQIGSTISRIMLQIYPSLFLIAFAVWQPTPQPPPTSQYTKFHRPSSRHYSNSHP